VATIDFKNVQLGENQSIVLDRYTLFFSELDDQSLKGVKRVKLLDKGFVSAKEYKSNPLPGLGTNTGVYHVSYSNQN
jgi:hypothetical protein